MKIKIPDTISSHQDLAAVIIELRDYLKWLSHHGIMHRLSAKDKSEEPELSSAAKDLLRDIDDKKIESEHVISELINNLENYKLSANSINITLAAPVTSTIKKNLVNWCRKNISQDILVDFKFNATILGGLVIRCGSHIYDWSFRRQILANRDKFPEVLRNV